MASALSFSQQHRLIGKSAFQAVFAQQTKIVYQSLLAFYTPSSAETDCRLVPAKLGIIIKKQIIRHAVSRNKLRRLIRESFRHAKTKIPLNGLNIVIIVRSKSLNDNPTALRANIDQLWPLIARARQKSLAKC